jgi:hypothetical protein
LKLSFGHKNGIIGTLLFHVIILSIALTSEMKQNPPVTFHVLVDQEMLDETPEEELERLKEELSRELEELYEQLGGEEIRNIAVNRDYEELKAAEYKATKYKSTMTDEEYEREIVRNALNQEEFEKYVENKPVFEEEVYVPEKREKKEKEKPQKTAYKGPATVVYYLDDRTSIYLDIPVYTCEGAAKVTVNIEVAPDGSVVKAVVDQKNSILATECYTKAATESAKSAFFSAVSNSKGNQSGSIVYHFVAQ